MKVLACLLTEGFVKEVQLKRRFVLSQIFSFMFSSCYNLLPFCISPDIHSGSVFKQTKTQKTILTSSISPFGSLIPTEVTQDFNENFCCCWGNNFLGCKCIDTLFDYKHINIIYIVCVLVKY